MKFNELELQHKMTGCWRGLSAKIQMLPTRVLVFLLIWFATGVSINQQDQKAFNLQQMGVDAIVSHGGFSLGKSDLAILKPLGDTFRVEKGIVAAKQPGQFVWGSIAYFFLKKIGLTYQSNYVLTASLVTFFSASLFSALAFTLGFCLLLRLGVETSHALLAIVSAGLASHWLVYAGIAHHDILAGSLLFAAFCLYELFRRESTPVAKYAIVGILLALTLFTSMLPALMVAVIGGFIMVTASRSQTIVVILGGGFGLLPLAIYNSYYFGDVFTQANNAGNYADTFFSFQLQQFLHHLHAYLGNSGLSAWKYAPMACLGIVAVSFYWRKVSALVLLIFSLTVIQLGYLLNIETLGTCQYGPRYLLPLIPFSIFGVAFLSQQLSHRGAYWGGILIGGIFAIALAVSITGAWGGAMQCDLNNFVTLRYWVTPEKFSVANLPLFHFLLIPFGLVLILLLINMRKVKFNSERI